MDGLLHWYSEEGTERAAAPPSPLLAVPKNSRPINGQRVPTSFYSMWHDVSVLKFVLATLVQHVFDVIAPL